MLDSESPARGDAFGPSGFVGPCFDPKRCAEKLEAFDRAGLLPLADAQGLA